MRTIIGVGFGAAVSSGQTLAPDGPNTMTSLHVNSLPTDSTRARHLPTNAELIELHNKEISAHWEREDEMKRYLAKEAERAKKGYGFAQMVALHHHIRDKVNAPNEEQQNPPTKRPGFDLDVHPDWKFDSEIHDIHNLTQGQKNKMNKETPGLIEMEKKLKKNLEQNFQVFSEMRGTNLYIDPKNWKFCVEMG